MGQARLRCQASADVPARRRMHGFNAVGGLLLLVDLGEGHADLDVVVAHELDVSGFHDDLVAVGRGGAVLAE
eukprot:513974-Hanusia_phi.AAC.1